MQSLWRIACVRIPRFPIAAVWGATAGEQLLFSLGTPAKVASEREHWDDIPIVLTDAPGKRLQAVSAAAGRAGVRAGMRPAEARALCAHVHLLKWSDAAIGAAITQASAGLVSASPQVTPVPGAPGLWWVGASGFDAVGGEHELAHALLRIAKRWHPRSRVAIAGSCVVARAATWAGASFQASSSDRALVHVVPREQDAKYLAPAPLTLVPMDGELRASLEALGLRTAGAFATLNADDVERRWGNVGLRAWRLANAEDARRPVLARVEAQPAVEVELTIPSATMEPVLFLVRAALDRLVADMIAHGRAIAAVSITLTLDDARGALVNAPAHTVTREARAAKPLARVQPLFERCRALLDSWTLDAPVSAVRVAIVAVAPLSGEQGDLLDKSWRDVGAAEAAFERLRAELGTGTIVRAEAQDTHRPEKAGVWADLHEDSRAGKRTDDDWKQSLPQPYPLPTDNPTVRLHVAEPPPPAPAARRALDPPELVEVICDGDIPCALTWRGQRILITRAIGPERLFGDWWDSGYRRDYWRCESAAGESVVFLDRADDTWKMQAWSD
ncbi:MAG: hypothetical protein JWM95_4969 [Gemmatimonadetes bacterium]|nr:hypothetical protein [Gemmatimonadota bacterium]